MAWSDQETIDAAARSLGAIGEKDFALGAATTYRVGGPAAIGVKAATERDLLRAADVSNIFDLDILVLGRGSNLLISDKGFEGIVVILSEQFGEITINGLDVAAGGAAPLPVLARKTFWTRVDGRGSWNSRWSYSYECRGTWKRYIEQLGRGTNNELAKWNSPRANGSPTKF